MKIISRKYLLAVYDLILAFGAIVSGIEMIESKRGVFTSFPKEWTTKLPFHSWVALGIIIIIIFGLGNMISGLSILYQKVNILWLTSGLMGLLLICCVTLQGIVLGELYMPNNYMILFSIIQLLLCVSVFLQYKKCYQ